MPPSVLLSKTIARAAHVCRVADARRLRVDEAHNGLQALERALDVTPDLVVTDLNIPGIDGFELTRRLKHDPRTREVPVLAVTGYAALHRILGARGGRDASGAAEAVQPGISRRRFAP